MAGKTRDEMPDEHERRAIALVTDCLLAVGGTWPMVMQELFRISRQNDPPFETVPSESTVERILLETLGYKNMTEYKAKEMESLKVSLKFKALNMAMSGHATMLIFCLKNICGWSDSIRIVDPEGAGRKPIPLAYAKGRKKK